MTYQNRNPRLELCPCWRSSGAEQLPCKQWVGGSNPPASASFCAAFSPTRGSHRMPAGSGRYPSGQRGQTVNLLAYAFGGSNPPLPTTDPGGNSSAVERQPSKLGVAGSNPVSRSIVLERRRAARVEGGLSEARVAALADSAGGGRVAALADIPGGGCVARLVDTSGNTRARSNDNGCAHVAQLAEHALGKGEVSGSIPDMGSRIFSLTHSAYGR